MTILKQKAAEVDFGYTGQRTFQIELPGRRKKRRRERRFMDVVQRVGVTDDARG